MFLPISDEDVPRIAELMNRAYRGLGVGASWNSEASYLAGDRTTSDLLRAEMLAMPTAAFLKWVEPSGGIVGCVTLQPEASGTWYLGSLAADPSLQRSGLGSQLLAAAEEWVRQRGGTRVRMTVINVRQALIDWYTRRGYALSGEIEPFPYGDDRFGKPLRDDLSFVVMAKDVASPSGAD